MRSANSRCKLRRRSCFLQEREFQRVGGTKTLHADVRIVAATNRNLEEWIQQGRFRLDLYYRLQVVDLRTPSLSQTREDIPLLAEHLLKRFRYIRMVSGISAEAMKALITCSWAREFEVAAARLGL